MTRKFKLKNKVHYFFTSIRGENVQSNDLQSSVHRMCENLGIGRVKVLEFPFIGTSIYRLQLRYETET
jgi:hypothetical protein